MIVKFLIHESRVDADGEPMDCGYPPLSVKQYPDDKLLDVCRLAVREYGIAARHKSCSDPWFVSVYHVEDREFFEQGIRKYYTLHFPGLLPHQLARVDKILVRLWEGA